MRMFNPAPGLFAFYDGRVPGYQYWPEPSWIDEGAMSLGIASFALVHGDEAVIYDTHVSIEHARFIRNALEEIGVRKFRVVLSHWHLDHVAGTEVFVDSTVIANTKTAAHLAERRQLIEAGELSGPPGIKPLLMPTEIFSGARAVEWSGERIELIEFNIHSDDGTVLWLPERCILLAGDTVEDTVTYVDEPENFAIHLTELARLAKLGATAIYPNHGTPEKIGGQGYGPDLITATHSYINALVHGQAESDLPLADLLPKLEGAAELKYFEPYEAVHRENVKRARAVKPAHG
jgi:cyclase